MMCFWRSSRDPWIHMVTQLKSAIEAVVAHVESGDHMKALAADPLQILFGDVASAELGDRPSDCLLFLKSRIAAFLSGQRHESSEDCEAVSAKELQARSILALAVGVAALLKFTQANKTRPRGDCEAFPLQAWFGKEVGSQWEAWANRTTKRIHPAPLQCSGGHTVYRPYSGPGSPLTSPLFPLSPLIVSRLPRFAARSFSHALTSFNHIATQI